MQNAVLRAAREAEPEETHIVLAMGTHDGSDLEHTVNARWYDAKRTKMHGFEVGRLPLRKPVASLCPTRRFTSMEPR